VEKEATPEIEEITKETELEDADMKTLEEKEDNEI